MSSGDTLLTPVIVGVDVGGTNTDAVALKKVDQHVEVIAAVKKLTTADVTTGVRNAVFAVLKQAAEKEPISVTQVNIGTTHFVNAVVQGRGLAKVSVIRLCGTTSRELPPFSDFPYKLKELICGSTHLCDGGYRFDGREIDKVDEKEILDIVREIRDQDIKNVAVSGVFSPVRSHQEETVLQMIQESLPEASVTLSHKIGQVGLLERENATILNECLKPLCEKTVIGFQNALSHIGVSCPIFLTQNDGTIISSADAMQFPVRTFASGPTNSMRGAAFLSNVKDAIVVDIGGTTTDVGVLKNRFPREASTQVKIADVRTNFRMPDVISFGLGGGSYVTSTEDEEGNVIGIDIGPLSAGYNLMNEALAFGHDRDDPSRKLTTTDIAVADGRCNLGDRKNLEHLSREFIDQTLAKIISMIEDAVDKVKVSDELVPVILVGGGSVLVEKGQRIAGTSEVIMPEFSGVANAIGAGLSQVSGCVDYVVSLKDMVDIDQMESAVQRALSSVECRTEINSQKLVDEARKPFYAAARDKAMEEGIAKATELAVRAGADAAGIEITEMEDLSLSYIPGQATRIKIKVVGELKQRATEETSVKWHPVDLTLNEHTSGLAKQHTTSSGAQITEVTDSDGTKVPVDPYIDPLTGEWILSEWDLEAIVIGAGIFGCGGGGNSHLGRIRALKAIRAGRKLRIISPELLLENADPVNDLVGVADFMGAPLVMYEQLVSTSETAGALQCLQELYSVGGYEEGVLRNIEDVAIKQKAGIKHISNFQINSSKSKTITALIVSEIGGMNAIEPLLVASSLDLPVVDADCMGRAFPELQMFVPFFHGVPPYPATLVDDRGRRAVVLEASSPKQLEDHFRDIVVQMGCSAGLSERPLNKAEVMNYTVLYSISRAYRLGDAVLRSRMNKTSPIAAILNTEMSVHILTGKIRRVYRETSGGFNIGKVVIEGLDDFSGQTILVEFQNENLIIFPVNESETPGKEMACVPDLITIVDADTAEPIPTEEVKYGMRVAVLVLAAVDPLKTKEALKYVGPKAFHYDNVTYVSIGQAWPVEPVPPKKLC